jgi:hypothetical protein
MKSRSLAAENAALQEELADLRAKLARPAAGQRSRNGKSLSVKQRNDLRAASKRIAKAWDGFDAPDNAWLTAQLDALPQELRTLRSDEAWREIVEKYIRRKQTAELIV